MSTLINPEAIDKCCEAELMADALYSLCQLEAAHLHEHIAVLEQFAGSSLDYHSVASHILNETIERPNFTAHIQTVIDRYSDEVAMDILSGDEQQTTAEGVYKIFAAMLDTHFGDIERNAEKS